MDPVVENSESVVVPSDLVVEGLVVEPSTGLGVVDSVVVTPGVVVDGSVVAPGLVVEDSVVVT